MLTDNSEMPFGKFKGKPLIDVPAAYLLSLLSNNRCRSDLKQYIEENKEALKVEMKPKSPELEIPDPFSYERPD